MSTTTQRPKRRVQRGRFETITFNFGGKVRRAVYNGREHYVVPVSMIVPGVLNGSKGPLLYPSDEIARDPGSWNGIPLVVYHPKDHTGTPISARSPDVLEKSGVGSVFNTRTNNQGKLRGEAWFDIERTRTVDKRVLDMIEAGKVIELSTGLFTDNEPSDGVFNGKAYKYIARNYRPDHLAILPDEVGACSVKDGCGVNVNASGGGNCGIGPGGFQPGNKCQKGGGGGLNDKVSEAEMAGARMHLKSRLGDFAKSKGTTIKTMAKKHGFKSVDQLVEAGVAAKYSGYKSLQEASKALKVPVGPKLASKLGVNSQTLQFDGVIIENVKRGDQTTNSNGDFEMTKLSDKQRKQLVDNLINNCECGGTAVAPGPWTEDDREALMAVKDEKLTAFDAQRKKAIANEMPAFIKKKVKAKDGEEETEDKKKMAANSAGAMTMEEFLQVAPPELKGLLNNATRIVTKQKEELVAKITANSRNRFTAEYLMGKDTDELEALAALAADPVATPPVSRFLGQAPIGNTTSAADVQKFRDEDSDFMAPTMNYEEHVKKNRSA